MGALQWIQLAIRHPLEFRSLVSYKLWHEPKRDITATKEHKTSGWDRQTMRRCWEFLDLTSRSFSVVIKELDGDLARTICLFYLALRGLDTIEDDMTIPDEIKQPLLRSFYLKLSEKGWNFDGNGPDEKDRQLLVEYDSFIEEMCLIKPEYVVQSPRIFESHRHRGTMSLLQILLERWGKAWQTSLIKQLKAQRP